MLCHRRASRCLSLAAHGVATLCHFKATSRHSSHLRYRAVRFLSMPFRSASVPFNSEPFRVKAMLIYSFAIRANQCHADAVDGHALPMHRHANIAMPFLCSAVLDNAPPSRCHAYHSNAVPRPSHATHCHFGALLRIRAPDGRFFLVRFSGLIPCYNIL